MYVGGVSTVLKEILPCYTRQNDHGIRWGEPVEVGGLKTAATGERRILCKGREILRLPRLRRVNSAREILPRFAPQNDQVVFRGFFVRPAYGRPAKGGIGGLRMTREGES